jgi:hypothetical protein
MTKQKRFLVLALLIATALLAALLLASRTPEGRAAANVVDYKLRSFWWSLAGQPQFDPAETGSIVGTIRDAAGEPIEDAIALVSTVRGEVFQARSDARGRYRLEGVPPGRYVPMAAAYRFNPVNGQPLSVSAGTQQSEVDFVLSPHVPEPVAPQQLEVGSPIQTSSQFPEPMVATRIPFTFTLDGVSVDSGQVYLPAEIVVDDAGKIQDSPLPTLVIIYPSHPLNWNAASVGLTRDGYAVLATGPDGERGLDIEGHVRDFRAVMQLWQEGRLTPLSPPSQQWVAMSGSFGSLILFRALPDLPQPPALLNVGGVSDAFLGIQALYGDELAIPPPYDAAIAALGRPDRDPAFFFGYSPVFFAEHLPPMFLIHTYNDEVIPYNQAEALDAALSAAEVPHDLLLYEDTTHYLDAYNPTPATAMVYERIMAWLASALSSASD